ncbi:MAG: hypothetical protein ACYTEG_05590 [Planctomycetota bacterium]
MPTESARRRDRQEKTRRRKAARERPSVWILIATGLGTAIIVGSLTRIVGGDGRRGVMFVAVVLAIACAAWARRWERERTRENPTWMVLVGLAGGFAAAAGFAAGGAYWGAALVAMGATLLVGVVVGNPPERQRGERGDLS